MATLNLKDGDGNTISSPRADERFSIGVDLLEAATGRPPQGLVLQGWIRPVDPTNLPCLEAARAFRATGRLPVGTTELNGYALFVFHTDGSFGIVDPKLNFSSANMLAAGSFELPVTLVSPARASQSVQVVNPATKEVMQVRMDGKIVPLSNGFDAPQHLLAVTADSFWISEHSSSQAVLYRKKKQIASATLDGPVKGIERIDENRIALWSARTLVLANAKNGEIIANTELQTPVSVAGFASLDSTTDDAPVIALTLGEESADAKIRYSDSFDESIDLLVPQGATRITINSAHNLAFLWDPSGLVRVVDIGRTKVIGGFMLKQGIGSIAFAGDAAFFMFADQSGVAVLDQTSVGTGLPINLHQVETGPRKTGSIDDNQHLMASLEPNPSVIAVNQTAFTGFVIKEHAMMADAPPMDAFSIRGGQPQHIVAMDRGFREDSEGHFVTGAIITQSGAHELVLTTGIGGMSKCFPLMVEGEPVKIGPTDKLVLDINTTTFQTEKSARLQLRLLDSDGNSRSLQQPLVRISSLEFGWNQTYSAIVEDGLASVDILLPVTGHYVVDLADQGIGRGTLAATIIEASK